MQAYRRISFTLAIFVVSTVWGQQGAPPKPAGAAQPLTAALAVIQKELNAVGKLNFVVHINIADEKGDAQYSEQLSNVVADPASCTIHYHWWRMMHGEVVNDEDVTRNLRSMLGVWMMSDQQYFKKVIEKEGSTPDDKGYYEKFEPTMYMVVMRVAEDDEESFSFTDEKQAGRVGKAMTQAVQLCGGKLGTY